jgi:hypothetical protein
MIAKMIEVMGFAEELGQVGRNGIDEAFQLGFILREVA